MPSFKTRIRSASRSNSTLILAADITASQDKLGPKVISVVSKVSDYVCAIKLNMHVLLPLGTMDIRKITTHAHNLGIQVIADIKLNDIGATNEATLEILLSMGFDAVIVNPIMGPKSLESLVRKAHKNSGGIIALGHMSAPEARKTYEQQLSRKKRIYHNFVKSASDSKADGLIVGATFPKIVAECSKIAPNVPIYSPGIGTQGGSAQKIAKLGTSYFIVGRTILHATNPQTKAAQIAKLIT